MQSKKRKLLSTLLAMVLSLFAAMPMTASATGLTATIGLSSLWGMDLSNGPGQAPWVYWDSTRTLELLGAGDTYDISGTNPELTIQVTTTATGAVIDSMNTNVTAAVQNMALFVQADCRLNTGSTFGTRFTISSGQAIFISSGRTLTIGSGSGVSGTGLDTLTATSTSGYGIRANGNLVLADTVHVTASGYPALDSSSPIKMSDGAKLTLINNSTSAETHVFQKLDTANTHMWMPTGSATTYDSLNWDSITVTIPAGTTGSIERTTPNYRSFGVYQVGGTSGTADSTGIGIAFSGSVENLTADDITITNGTGAVTKGTLSGSGTIWTIGLASVTAEGTVTVSIADFYTYVMLTAPQTVAVYKNNTPPPAIAVTSTGLTGLKVGQAVSSASIVYTLTNGTYAAAITASDFAVSGLPAGLTAGTATRTNNTTVTVPITGTPTTANASTAAVTLPASIPMANVASATANITPTGTVTASAVAKGTLVIGDLAYTIPTTHVYTTLAQGIGTVTCAKAGAAAITVKYNTVATAPTNAGTYAVTVDVAESANYAAATFSLGNYTIARIDLSGVTISANFGTLTYNGLAQTPTPTSVTFDGEAVAVTTSYSLGGWANNTNAGTNTASVVFTGAGNFIGTKTVNFSIGAKPLTLIADNKTVVVGALEPTYTYTVVGLVGSDTAAVITTAPTLSAPGFSSVAPATFTITITGGATTNTNYTIGTRTNGTVTVSNKTPVTITGVTVANKTYNGVPVAPSGTAVVTGSTGNHLPLVYTYTKLADMSTSTTAPKDAGYYTLVISTAATDPNYIGESAAISFNIAKATITITAENKSATVGAAQPVYTYTVSGLAGGESLATNPTVTCPTANMATAGNYPIIPSGAVAPAGDNYNAIVYANGTLTVMTPSTGGGTTYYTVTFNSNGGSVVASQSVALNGKAAKPADPTKAGFTFAGWYTDTALTAAYDFNKAVTSSFTLYAKWTAVAPKPFPFTDVPQSAWYYNDVKTAWELGLIDGTTATTFSPNNSLTYAEAVKLAACMHQLYMTGAVSLTNGNPWYQSYVDYAKGNGIINKDYNWTAPATRADYIEIFANALPAEAYKVINTIADGAIPDVAMTHAKAAAIYKMYRAGIVQGVDAAHNCLPEATIRRCEVAAIVNRMMNESARIKFSI